MRVFIDGKEVECQEVSVIIETTIEHKDYEFNFNERNEVSISDLRDGEQVETAELNEDDLDVILMENS